MNKEAFTLIELIMVITLLGIIALIAVPTINNVINDSKEKATAEQQRLIIDAAKTYISSNSTKLPSNDKCYIDVDTLQKAGFIKEGANGVVEVSWTGSKYNYEYRENSESINEC